MNEDLLPAFRKIAEVVAELRQKCPWDREQTKESIRHLSIEEVYELSDAVLRNNWADIRNETGDLLLHVLFYCRIAEEQNQFSTQEMIEALTAKLIRRHPHIYGDTVAETPSEVVRNWEEIKMNEKKTGKGKVLDGVPESMPSLIQSFRIQEKVSSVGFDWKDVNDVRAKVREEWDELEEAISMGEKKAMEEEFGDLLFSLVNHARFLGINPDDALSRTNLKFKRRFGKMEEEAGNRGKELRKMTLVEMDEIWEMVKEGES